MTLDTLRKADSRRSRSWLAGLLLFAAALASGAATAQDSEPAPAAEGESTVDAQLDALKPGVCAANEDLCRHFKAFVTGVAPCLAQGEQFTAGHAYLIADDGTITPAEYYAVNTQRVRDVTLIQAQHVYSENAQEKQAAEDLVQSIRSGAVDPGNPLYQYLQRRRAEIPELLAEREQRTLVVRREGPTLYLRQAGKLLYAAMPDARVTIEATGDRLEGLLFAVLPARSSCQ
jgi:hypothetical protein